MKNILDIIQDYNLIRTIDLKEMGFKGGRTCIREMVEMCHKSYVLSETKRLLIKDITELQKRLRYGITG